MNRISRSAPLLFALMCAAPLAQAANDPASSRPGCVNLGKESEQLIARQGSVRHFLLRDGHSYYQVSLSRKCSALPAATAAIIERNGNKNLLCQRGSTLRTDRGACDISRVERIDAEAFSRLADPSYQ